MLFALRLEAHHDARDRHRVYELNVVEDLFGELAVEIRHGRTGRRLSLSVVPVSDLAAAQALVRSKLRRRASAPRRIGCSYRVKSVSALDDVDVAGFFVDPRKVAG